MIVLLIQRIFCLRSPNFFYLVGREISLFGLSEIGERAHGRDGICAHLSEARPGPAPLEAGVNIPYSTKPGNSLILFRNSHCWTSIQSTNPMA